VQVTHQERIQNSFWGDDLDEFIASNSEESLMKETGNVLEQEQNQETVEIIQETPALKHEPEKEAPQPSREVEREITNIKYKYLIGKKVGETLLDSNGQVIASKNSHITAEVIEKAEKEGKLVNLIVNMIIPESSE